MLLQHANQFSDFLGKPCLNRPAESLRCLPVTAVRPVLYLNLQPDCTNFLYCIPLCFFIWRTSDCLFLIRLPCSNLQCFAEGSLPSALLAELSQLDPSSPFGGSNLFLERTLIQKKCNGDRYSIAFLFAILIKLYPFHTLLQRHILLFDSYRLICRTNNLIGIRQLFYPMC